MLSLFETGELPNGRSFCELSLTLLVEGGWFWRREAAAVGQPHGWGEIDAGVARVVPSGVGGWWWLDTAVGERHQKDTDQLCSCSEQPITWNPSSRDSRPGPIIITRRVAGSIAGGGIVAETARAVSRVCVVGDPSSVSADL